ncbi:MAG: YihY/virulence factor BrkB family protein [Butyricicoccus sp.]|nr:YihY/virulence factor BrkB family protein [Butyricicoccus sp.]
MNGQNRLIYLVRRMVVRFFADGISQAAAALSYFLLFSMLPLLMFVGAIIGRLNISVEDFRPVFELMPKSLQELILSYFGQLSVSPSFSPMLIGTLLTLYFLSRAVRSMMRTVDRIYRVEVHRRAVLDILLSFAMTAGFLLTVVCSFVLVVAGRMLLHQLARMVLLPVHLIESVRGTGFWMMIALVFVFLMLFNKIVPNLHLGFREVWPGALFSLVAWVLVSWCFSFYVDNMAQYSVLYGSLATAIVLMLWLYLVSMILLMGPQLNHTLVVMRLYRIEQTAHLK